MLDKFRDLIKRQEEIEAYYKSQFEGFTQKLSSVLNELVFAYWQHLAKRRNIYTSELIKLGEKYARLIFEDFNCAHWLNNNEGSMANLSVVLKPGSDREHAEKRLEKFKKQFPKTYHPELEKSFWQDYEKEQKSVRFKYAVYEQMKAVFTEFYFDDIIEFESHILRHFDRSLYLMCTLRYVDEVYSLE